MVVQGRIRTVETGIEGMERKGASVIKTKDLEFLGTLDTGVYFELYCSKCKQEIIVSQSGKKEKCKCGYVWRLEFVAVGERELA